MLLPRVEKDLLFVSYKEPFFLVLKTCFKNLSIRGLLVLLVG